MRDLTLAAASLILAGLVNAIALRSGVALSIPLSGQNPTLLNHLSARLR